MKLKYNVKIQRIVNSIVAVLDDDNSLKPRILNLNEQGEDILKLIMDGLDTDDVIIKMQEMYSADPELIKKDTLAFIQQLKDSGIVE
jgi:hypothetical protein